MLCSVDSARSDTAAWPERVAAAMNQKVEMNAAKEKKHIVLRVARSGQVAVFEHGSDTAVSCKKSREVPEGITSWGDHFGLSSQRPLYVPIYLDNEPPNQVILILNAHRPNILNTGYHMIVAHCLLLATLT